MNTHFRLSLFILLLFFSCSSRADVYWKTKESDHFKVIYRPFHSEFTDYILKSAENSFEKLSKVFGYEPSDKILILTHDIYDYGQGRATSVPENIIRLGISPPEPGYENITYKEHIQWVISHELVHIIVNDQGSDLENFFRTLFSKVPPEQKHPISLYYSLLTNFSRYTPTWHQESIAVFFETFMGGGYGRILSSFDEMYFRSMILENKTFPSTHELETITSHNSFLLGKLYYLYGTRFGAYLVNEYGPEKFISWYKTAPDEVYDSYISKFEDIYKTDFDVAWNSFIKNEIEFQKENLKKIKSSKVTKLIPLTKSSVGWISQPFVRSDSTILFSAHIPHNLAAIYSLNINKGNLTKLETLPTPSMHQVASTAYDDKLDYYFYTTNNNQFYRDLWLYDLNKGKSEMLFEDCRVGHLTTSSNTQEIWGIRHSGGRSSLVYSKYPFDKMASVFTFKFGIEIYQLSVNPAGNKLAAVIHTSDGSQRLCLVDLNKLKNNNKMSFEVITDKGGPENPSWNKNGDILYWNSVTNGVSNIYKYTFKSEKVIPISNTERGLFKPINLSGNNILAFEFTSEGFQPVLFKNDEMDQVPAISYFGQNIGDKYPELYDLSLNSSLKTQKDLNITEEKNYSNFSNLNVLSFIPVFTGFQEQKVFGFYTHIANPTNTSDLTFEFGYSPFDERPGQPKFHIKTSFEYKKKLTLSYDYNAPDFYDLFNKRKTGQIGSKLSLNYKHYYKYDNPLKTSQNTTISYYHGIKYWNENTLLVDVPNFMIGRTDFVYNYLRKSIGSCDYEQGNKLDMRFFIFGFNPDNPKFSYKVYGQWDNYSLWLVNHNVLHFKLGAGYLYNPDNLVQSQFFFGGFGNRHIDNQKAKHFRKIFRFPGIPMYSLSGDKFVKVFLENNFPPIRLNEIYLGQQLANHIDFSIFSQGLLINSVRENKWFSVGAQLNIIFKHWYNIESTLSFGAAKAWNSTQNFDLEYFMSFKIMKN